MRTAVLVIACGMLAGAVQAGDLSPLDDSSLSGRNRYDRCLALAKRDPEDAVKAAIAWNNSGGDGAAGHCTAVALVELRRYPEAAARLDGLGHENVGGAEQRASLFDQAGNAWLLAHRGGEAVNSFSAALALSPRDPDLLADRARADAMLGDWRATDGDLTAALVIDSNRADLLVLRASARHALGRKAEARADLESALRIVPNYPEALLERGALKLQAGDLKGARADWQAVITRAKGSEAAQAAEQRLNALPQSKPK
jgi:tetratricopeptide (TPR) repeat protein